MARKKRISVKPYIPSGYRFLGLERYNMVLFDNCKQKEHLTYVEVNGIKRYITGLDEFAPSITSIANEAVRNEKIKEIRRIVADLELKMIYNKIDPDDKDFWSKVKLLHATNAEFWSKIFVELTNEGFELDIYNNPHHMILYHCIKAGGFNIIAPSYKAATSNPNKYYFYLDTPEEMDAIDATEKKLKNKAIAILSSLEEGKKHKKLLYLAKILLENSTEYTLEHTIYDLYTMLDDYITYNGKVLDNAAMFIKYASIPEQELSIYALLSDLRALKKIYYKDLDAQYYCTYTNSFLGRTMEDCVKYLLMPNNRIMLETIINKYREDLMQIGIKSDIDIIKEQAEIEVREALKEVYEKVEDESIEDDDVETKYDNGKEHELRDTVSLKKNKK